MVSRASSTMKEHSLSLRTGDALSKIMFPFLGRHLASVPALLAPRLRPRKASSPQQEVSVAKGFSKKASLPLVTSEAWMSITARWTSSIKKNLLAVVERAKAVGSQAIATTIVCIFLGTIVFKL